MATWITHLRLAENLLNIIPGLEPEQFANGNIAPDSGIPDEKWENFNPDPKVTHFSTDPNQRALADLEFFRQYLLPLRQDSPNTAQFSFRLGYFFHLVTDNLWSVAIGLPIKQRFTEQFAADKDFIWEVKKDWYGLDHLYVRKHPESLFWQVFLGCQATEQDLDFLPLEALQQRITYIQEYYQRRDAEIESVLQRPFIYLSQAEWDHFVEEATARLFSLHQALWKDGHSDGGASSSLELLI